MKMIDVSHHNGNIDFNAVKSSGVGGVIIRAGYGDTLDRQFINNITACNSVGLHVGIYWFSYAYTEGQAQAEARRCADAIRPYNVDLPVFFDWEYDSMNYAKKNGVNPTRALITNMTRAFCSEIEAQGYKAGFYFNEDYRKNWIDVDSLDYYKWYARYISSISVPCDIWQFASDGVVNGIGGKVDLDDLLNESLIDNPTPTPQPTPEHYDVYYAVQSANHTYEEVENDSDYAGGVKRGDSICNLAAKISSGLLEYRVHVKGGDWLPWVNGYDWNDKENGYAGNGEPIDGVQMRTGEDVNANIMYRVSPCNAKYYSWVTECNDYAGKYGKEIDRIQIKFDR